MLHLDERETNNLRRTHLLDRRPTAFGALKLDFADAREADSLDLCSRPLEDRSLIVDFDPDPDEFRPVGQQ